MVCAQGIARAHLKYSDVGWRGKGQNKCYGITMDSVCSLTLYTLYTRGGGPPFKTAAATNISLPWESSAFSSFFYTSSSSSSSSSTSFSFF